MLLSDDIDLKMPASPSIIPAQIHRVSRNYEFSRIDRFLLKNSKIEDRDIVKLIIERGGVLLNDRIVTFPSKKLHEGDKIFVREIILLRDGYTPGELKILHQDNSIVVIEKPSGVLSEPEEGQKNHLFQILKRMLAGVKFYLVHRLDKETSGVMVVALTQQAMRFLKKQFSEKKVRKRYIAIVQGEVKNDTGVIKGIMRTSGEFGESRYNVIERLKYATLLEVFPRTGRTNQIRIQFSELGHPLLGEYKYLKRSEKRIVITERVALHSAELSFVHPETEETLTFNSPLPEEMKGYIDALKKM